MFIGGSGIDLFNPNRKINNGDRKPGGEDEEEALHRHCRDKEF